MSPIDKMMLLRQKAKLLLELTLAKYSQRFYHSHLYRNRVLAVNLTDECNSRCVACRQWKNGKSRELSSEQWLKVFQECKALSIDRVAFAGGEPLLRPDLVDLVHAVSSLRMGASLITNGLLLNDATLDRLTAAGLQHISLSVDGVGQDYDAVRMPGVFPLVMKAARSLADAVRLEKIAGAYICFTLMKDTVSHFMSVAELAMQLKIPLVVNLFDTTPYFFKQTEKSRREKWLHDPVQITDLIEKMRTLKRRRPQALYHGYVEVDYCGKYFTDPLQKSIPCAASQQRICVDARGNVYGGCWSMEPFGNLTTVPLSEIVDSEAYRQSHRDMFYKNCPGCSCGYTTNLRHDAVAILQETVLRVRSHFY
jgi:MoaA/NifB/PqqE/SkfB family radical SAM enzyme